MTRKSRRCTPDRSRFSPAEWRLIERLRTPRQVQHWLRTMPYNWEREGPTVRTFRGVVRHGQAHCLEAVLAAAAVLEHRGHPPTVLDLESQDNLEHVLFLFGVRGRWGAIGKSRDPGLHGRRPLFRTVRDLVYSYVDPYVDGTGRIIGYGVFDLDELTLTDWRLGEGHVPSVVQALIDGPHRMLATSDRRYRRMYARYRAAPAGAGGRPVLAYHGQEKWW